MGSTKLFFQQKTNNATTLFSWAVHDLKRFSLGNEGGNHIISILKTQLKQVMEQVSFEKPAYFCNHYIG
jgi:hypothetical protein